MGGQGLDLQPTLLERAQAVLAACKALRAGADASGNLSGQGVPTNQETGLDAPAAPVKPPLLRRVDGPAANPGLTVLQGETRAVPMSSARDEIEQFGGAAESPSRPRFLDRVWRRDPDDERGW